MPKQAAPQVFDPAQAEQVRPYLARLLNSEAFRKAPNLRHLLEYLVTQSNEGHTEQLKETVIAIEVFGRRTDFDGRIDNIVRVQAHRLRKLLETYYATEGKDDKLRVAVPRGGYVPQFSFAEEATGVLELAEPEAVTTGVVVQNPAATAQKFPWVQTAAFAAVFVVGGLLGMWAARHGRAVDVDPAVSELWGGIFEPDAKVIVSFTNPAFLRVGRSRTYLMYQGPLSAPPGTQVNIPATDPALDQQYGPVGQPLFFSDGWTGTGEVLGVNRLSEMSAQFKKPIEVVASRALALEQIRDANVIFLGSPWFNGVLAQIGNDSTPIYNTNDGRILVREPRKGEQAAYENVKDPATSEIKSGYALFSVLPGLNAARRVVSSAGLSTWSTWSGIDFATTAAGSAQIARALKAVNGGIMPRFYQAVVRAEILKGSVSNESLVTARVVQPGGAIRR